MIDGFKNGDGEIRAENKKYKGSFKMD